MLQQEIGEIGDGIGKPTELQIAGSAVSAHIGIRRLLFEKTREARKGILPLRASHEDARQVVVNHPVAGSFRAEREGALELRLRLRERIRVEKIESPRQAVDVSQGVLLKLPLFARLHIVVRRLLPRDLPRVEVDDGLRRGRRSRMTEEDDEEKR